MKNFLYSLITFIIALFFIMAGILCILIPWSPTIRTNLISFILEDSVTIFLFGLAFFLIGAATASYILLGTRKRYFHLQSKRNPVAVDESIIEFYLNSYWKQVFPDREIPNRLTLKKNKISVTADLPYIPFSEQKPLLNRIQNDLEENFTKLLGNQFELDLFISFQEKPTEPSAK